MSYSNFDRSVCFYFFNSHLERAKTLTELYGAERGYKFLVGIAEYGLYKISPSDPQTNYDIEPFKSGIDRSQAKRKAWRENQAKALA